MASRKKPASTRAKAARAVPAEARSAGSGESYPIVGVGASAGGLEAFTELLRRMPDAPGMAFVFVLHHDGRPKSDVASVLGRATPMKVLDAENGARVECDRVYVTPPGAEIEITAGRLVLQRPKGGAVMPIDRFFRSLALDQTSRAVGVVLSGNASDGAAGLRLVKAEGGITFAQDASARFGSMPTSAIANGSVDFVLSASAIGEELLHLARRLSPGSRGARLPEQPMREILSLLRVAHDVDFSHYKPSTIERRILRRMAISRADTLERYLQVLTESPAELENLYGDLLIHVTGFFRDPEVFEFIKKEIAPEIVKDRTHENPVRVWVPGCATGEEVYSLAITLMEAAAELGVAPSIQIFGTDISDPSIERARIGWYPEDIVAEVAPERLRRFFIKSEGGYRVAKAVRDICIFARQNLAKDPPFSRIDLISCRNVMIYLGQSLQRKVMSVFHYALKPNGFLLLGSSETIGAFAEMFAVADRRNKIYRKKPGSARPSLQLDSMVPPPERATLPLRMEPEAPAAATIFREADRVLLARYSPPGVLVSDDLEILQFRGRTSPFLEPAPGQASFNILKMAREGLLGDLRAALHSASKRDVPVRRDGIRVRRNGGFISVNVEVIPIVSSTRDRYYMVLFEEKPVDGPVKQGKGGKGKKGDAHTKELQRLKGELESTREYLQSIIEEQEAMNEELRSANEEIQSSNEELQSTNEELETAKEELQSSNEELTTLNEELENRNQELADVNNDLLNLLSSVDIPILMLDSTLRIRRFNPGAQRTFNVIPSDIGRPITDLELTLEVDDLDKVIREVIENLEIREMEVRSREGKWYSLRIRPYRTLENRIDGAVLVLVDIDAVRRAASSAS